MCEEEKWEKADARRRRKVQEKLRESRVKDAITLGGFSLASIFCSDNKIFHLFSRVWENQFVVSLTVWFIA